jgi:perosamine synthetase
MNRKIIPLSVPNISGNEWKYVKECLDTGWISSVGSYVEQFEQKVAEFVDSKYGVAAVNGTAILHIAQILANVNAGDYVIVPNITFIATANSVKYLGAEPIFIDADPNTWQMDLDLLESFLSEETILQGDSLVYKKNKKLIKAIIPVHVQGNIFDMERFLRIAQNFNLFVIEDAAESLGSKYNGKHGGTFGKMGCFSFNGNKIISTGGGGVLVTDDETLAKKAKHLTTTAKSDPMLYFHDEVGYNYRLVNVLAAIGVAQMEQLDKFILKKKKIADFYKKNLDGIIDIKFQKVLDKVDYNEWLFTIQTNHQAKLLEYLNKHKILSRPFWMPMNMLPMFKDSLYITKNDNCKYIHETCLSIPCSTNITNEEQEIVINEIKNFFNFLL